MDRDIRILGLAALAAAILAPAVAVAQAPPATPKTEQLDPKACNGDRATVGQGGGLDVQKPDGRDLSDRLARSGGVICPPDHVDPDIKASTPPGGTMTVIPPPGSRGGDPSIVPK